MKDTLVRVERHWKVTGVGDLDDVGSDVTKDDVAKVQDVLWQLDSEMVNRLTSPFKTWKATFPKVKESDFFFFSTSCAQFYSPEWRTTNGYPNRD